MYWFEGVMVHLVARLDKPDAIPQSVTSVAQRAREDCSWQPVDAVLVSIAHVVLVRVLPGSKLQHTKPLHLFVFGDQPSQDPRERFPPSKPKELSQRKARVTAKRTFRDERQVRQRNDPDAAESGDNDSPEEDSEYDESFGSIYSDLPGAIDLEGTYIEIAKTEPSFFALALLFDASKRARRPLSIITRGYLSIEIYRLIIDNVEDVETLSIYIIN